MSHSLPLADAQTRDDLRTYLQRLARAGHPETRLLTRGSTLAVYGCTQEPRGITDQLPVVLVMRAFSLRAAPEPSLDTTVRGRAIMDRLARLGDNDLELDVPDETVMAAWTGVLPPTEGWTLDSRIDAASLSRVAASGIERVAELLPESPGEAVVHSVRSSVWGAELAAGIPAAAAFALEAMGFLGDAPVNVHRSLTWVRLSTPAGYVLVRSLLG